LSAYAVQPLKVDFSNETVSAEPKSFVSVAGVWRIEADGNNKVLVVETGIPAGTRFWTHRPMVEGCISTITP
jgi:hypothetical protein